MNDLIIILMYIYDIVRAFLLLGVSCLALFGWTVGGVVALEYDISPVSLRLGLHTLNS